MLVALLLPSLQQVDIVQHVDPVQHMDAAIQHMDIVQHINSGNLSSVSGFFVAFVLSFSGQ